MFCAVKPPIGRFYPHTRPLPKHRCHPARRFSTNNESSGDKDVDNLKPSLDIKIDISGLKFSGNRNLDESHILDHEHSNDKRPPTRFEQFLSDVIAVRGPLPLSMFMKSCLSNPSFGYYMKQDVFGRQGDFITSPEVSQVFGELIGIWGVHTWMQMKEPSQLAIVELGPGRGTLMADMLRAARKFPKFLKSVQNVHLVEMSPALRKLQAKALGCSYDAPTIEPFQKKTTPSITIPETFTLNQPDEKKNPEDDLMYMYADKNWRSIAAAETQEVSSKIPELDITVHWHRFFSQVPKGIPVLVIAHEFFDCMPVHQFEFTAEYGWCEKLVDQDPTNSSFYFRFALAKGPTLTSVGLLKDIEGIDDAKVGDKVEVSPEAKVCAKEIAERIAQDGGAALIADYGEDKLMGDTIRGIQAHKLVPIFQDPGNVDLSCNVDFSALKKTARSVENVNAYGVVTQQEFLHALGIQERFSILMKNATEEQKKTLFSQYLRLTSPAQMGTTYKFMTIANKSVGVPAGFHDDNTSSNTS